MQNRRTRPQLPLSSCTNLELSTLSSHFKRRLAPTEVEVMNISLSVFLTLLDFGSDIFPLSRRGTLTIDLRRTEKNNEI